MKFLQKIQMEDIFVTDIFPTVCYGTELNKCTIPEDGFYEIVTETDVLRVDRNSDFIENNYDTDGTYIRMRRVVTMEQNGPVIFNRKGSGKRKAPPKPPRMKRSDSSISNSSTGSSGTDSSNQFLTRKSCSNCNCDKDEHEVPMADIINSYKMNRLSLHDTNEKISVEEPDSDEYLWVPPGVDDDLIEQFMKSLLINRIPNFNNPEGIKYHNQQLMRQFPLQDSNFENITTLSPKEKYLLDGFKKERDAEMGTGKVLKATDGKRCNNCRKDIDIGDVYVNAPTLGPTAAWHPNCFECSTCNELLADLVYCFRNGEMFCVRHHAEQIKPRCVMCDELIFGGEYIRTDEKSYHSQHFVCCVCEKELSGEQHLVDQGFPICICCYDSKYASTCHMCHKIIGVDEEDVIYDDEHWHDYCLVCHLCKCRLSGTSFVIKDDNFLCSNCYQKTDDKRCGTCGKGFEPGAKRLELKGEYWHDSCFVCDVCKDPITSKRFIQHEGKQVCCPCFDNNFAKRCEKCKVILREGGVACGGAFYHRDCFACENCNTSIASQAFQQKDGKRFCTPCYKDLYAKKCSACDDFIVNGEFFTVDSDNWHKECFRCVKCNEILQQQSFVQENGRVKLVCENCL